MIPGTAIIDNVYKFDTDSFFNRLPSNAPKSPESFIPSFFDKVHAQMPVQLRAGTTMEALESCHRKYFEIRPGQAA